MKRPKSTVETGFVALGFFGMPFLAVALITRGVYVAGTPNLLSPLWAIVMGLTLGAMIVTAQIISCGHDMMDFFVPYTAIILLCLCGWGLPQNLKNKRLSYIQHRQTLRRKQRREQSELRSHRSSQPRRSSINSSNVPPSGRPSGVLTPILLK